MFWTEFEYARPQRRAQNIFAVCAEPPDYAKLELKEQIEADKVS